MMIENKRGGEMFEISQTSCRCAERFKALFTGALQDSLHMTADGFLRSRGRLQHVDQHLTQATVCFTQQVSEREREKMNY